MKENKENPRNDGPQSVKKANCFKTLLIKKKKKRHLSDKVPARLLFKQIGQDKAHCLGHLQIVSIHLREGAKWELKQKSQ